MTNEPMSLDELERTILAEMHTLVPNLTPSAHFAGFSRCLEEVIPPILALVIMAETKNHEKDGDQDIVDKAIAGVRPMLGMALVGLVTLTDSIGFSMLDTMREAIENLQNDEESRSIAKTANVAHDAVAKTRTAHLN